MNLNSFFGGVKGYVVRGRGTYASNSIFLPCAGNVLWTSLRYYGSYGGYWSSVPLGSKYDSWELGFNFVSDAHGMSKGDGYYGRSRGNPVRPVQ
ncbi:MAG: hypothetical protein IJQ00_09120 [Kiritimatiellae bacterium]|nr:hypothetical protein [Kiritimatiellia bacterium]